MSMPISQAAKDLLNQIAAIVKPKCRGITVTIEANGSEQVIVKGGFSSAEGTGALQDQLTAELQKNHGASEDSKFGYTISFKRQGEQITSIPIHPHYITEVLYEDPGQTSMIDQDGEAKSETPASAEGPSGGDETQQVEDAEVVEEKNETSKAGGIEEWGTGEIPPDTEDGEDPE